MAEPLKNYYNAAFVQDVATSFDEVVPDFPKDHFISFVLDAEWENRELRGRTRHLTAAISHFLKDPFPVSVRYVCEASKTIKGGLNGFFLPDFLSENGMEFWDESMKAMEILTAHSTGEFAIRPFIETDFEKAIQQFPEWATHDSEHVRRLVSEGTRSRLPWASKVASLYQHPERVISLLETLHLDSSEYVRRSVANNLNDIAKDHPSLVKAVCKAWYGKTPETSKLVKHALRTLLKKGDREALDIIGVGNAKGIKASALHCSEEVQIGQDLQFELEISNTDLVQMLRVEYAIHYVKSNGSKSKKVFHWSLNDWKASQTKTLKKKQSFKNMTTRVHYKGEHLLEVIVNGEVVKQKTFLVIHT
ncbi:MAG: DNA alkylation repair protein [Flavobacteriales bacterium]|nr:DNA alkylation repair protein [Flavobacteriales bacterium]